MFEHTCQVYDDLNDRILGADDHSGGAERLGGVNIMGGEGKIAGTFLSIAIITMIYNGLDLGGVHSIWQIGTLGMILIFSVLLNQFLIRRQGE